MKRFSDTHGNGFLLAERVLVTEPDLHGAIRPGGAQAVGGEDAVGPDSVPPGALIGHPPPGGGAVEQSRSLGPDLEQGERAPRPPLDQDLGETRGTHHDDVMDREPPETWAV